MSTLFLALSLDECELSDFRNVWSRHESIPIQGLNLF